MSIRDKVTIGGGDYPTMMLERTYVCDGCGKEEVKVFHGCQAAAAGASGGWWCECGTCNTYGQFAIDVAATTGVERNR